MRATELESQCDRIYEHLKNDQGLVCKSSFFQCLQKKGILNDDPRIKEIWRRSQTCDAQLTRQSFVSLISDSVAVIGSALTSSNVIPDFETFTQDINDIYRGCLGKTKGEVSTRVCHLPSLNPDHFGVSVCTVSGQRYNVGDANIDFCLLSCAKPINYCLALEEHGIEKLHTSYVGREPSGIAADALQLNHKNLPHNPIINAGAIMVCSLIRNSLDPAARFKHILDTWGTLAGGHSLGYSKNVFQHQRTNGYRNFAMAYIMEENKTFPEKTNIVHVLETYFKCQSLTVKCQVLSIVAATLANGGICPLTNKRVFSPDNVKHCLSAMYASGLYTYTGEFSFTCGLPGSASESGGIFLIIPNVMGICTYSPRLDSYGNSTRGIEFFTCLTKKFSFHLLHLGDESECSNPTKDQDDMMTEKVIKCCSLGDVGALQRLRVAPEVLQQGDYDKRTPLHLSVSNGHHNMVRYLTEKLGLDHVNPLDRWGGTPYDDALRENHQDIAQMLRSVGGKMGKEL